MNDFQIEMVSTSELNPAAYNPRKHLPELIEELKKGIEKFGFVDPIIINADNTIIGGHQRHKAAIELGMDEVPCIRLNIDKGEEMALNISLNKKSGEFDEMLLKECLTELCSIGLEEFSGFGEIELSDMFNSGDGGSNDNTYHITIECGSLSEMDTLVSEFSERGLSFKAKQKPHTEKPLEKQND